MLRAILEHQGDSIELPLGETLVGRDVACQLRLNDPGVSRRHLRFMLSDDALTVEDLGSRNGTTLNGRALAGARSIGDGDEIAVGGRTMRVRVIVNASDEFGEQSEPTENVPRSSIAPATESAAANTARAFEPVPLDLLPARVIKHSCPKCRARVPVAADRCPDCGYIWPSGRALAVTLSPVPVAPTIPQADGDRSETIRVDRRADRRRAVEIAVIYTSPTLTFDAVAHDLSHRGMFVRTELLEPVGTQCRVIVLPDVSPAISFDAVVSRVVQQRSEHEKFAGLGLMFSSTSPEAEHWLDKILAKLDASAVDRVWESLERSGPKKR